MKQALGLAVFLIFVLASPVQALAASLSLSPSSGTFNRGCSFTLTVNLNTAGVETDGTDVFLLYDNSRVTALSITPGTIYADYPGNNADDASGKVTVSGLASVSQPFNGQGIFATVNFQVKENAPTGATQIKFDFDPNNMAKTTDSNVVQRSTVQDVLSSVVNGNYTIGTGSCGLAASPSPSASAAVVSKGAPGSGTGFESTPLPQEKLFKTLPPAGGNEQLTLALTIIGSVLAVLGILGLTLL